MTDCIININKRKINAVEVPESAEVEVGEDLILKLVNHGAPLHVTVSAVNARRFTLYLHENIYLKENMEFRIPILSTAPTGSFQIEVIAGYGTVKQAFAVKVADRALEMPDEIEDIPESEPEPKNYGYPLLLILLLIAGWLVYIFGSAYFGDLSGFASVIILTLAVVIAWFWRP